MTDAQRPTFRGTSWQIGKNKSVGGCRESRDGGRSCELHCACHKLHWAPLGMLRVKRWVRLYGKVRGSTEMRLRVVTLQGSARVGGLDEFDHR